MRDEKKHDAQVAVPSAFFLSSLIPHPSSLSFEGTAPPALVTPPCGRGFNSPRVVATIAPGDPAGQDCVRWLIQHGKGGDIMGPLWRNVLAWVGLPLLLAALAGGSILLHRVICWLLGRTGELLMAWLGLYILTGLGCTLALACALAILDRDHIPPRRWLLFLLLLVPALLAGLILLALQEWCAEETARELILVAGVFGCFILVLLECNLVVGRLERRLSPPASDDHDPNDPNSKHLAAGPG
jgi:hypothetical protein